MINPTLMVTTLVTSYCLNLGGLTRVLEKQFASSFSKLFGRIERGFIHTADGAAVKAQVHPRAQPSVVHAAETIAIRTFVRAGVRWRDIAGDAQPTAYVPVPSPEYSHTPLKRRPFPITADLRQWDNPIQTQSKPDEAAAYAAVAAMENYLYRDSRIQYKLSEQSTYTIAESKTVQDSYKAAINDGATYAKVVSVNGVTIGDNRYRIRMAKAHSIASLKNFNDVVSAINQGHPVVLVLGITEQFRSNRNGLLQTPTQAPDANHAVTVVGYQLDEKDPNQSYLIIRNSWGSEWGDRGYGYLPINYCQAMSCAGFEVKNLQVDRI